MNLKNRISKTSKQLVCRHYKPIVFSISIGTLILGSGFVVAQGGKLPNWSNPITKLDNTKPGAAAVAIGENSAAPDAGAIAIGHGAIATGHPEISNGAGIETTALGEDALAEGWRCTAIGAKAKAGVVSATAIGRGAYAWGPHMIAIGRGAYMEQVRTAPDLNVGNATGIAGSDLYLGGMMAHKIVDRTGDTEVIPKENGGDGKKRWNIRTHGPTNYTIHGMDAFDARFAEAPELYDAAKYDPKKPETWINKPSLNIAGGDLTVAAGRGTGTGEGGSLVLQTAPAGKVGINRKNALKTAVEIDSDYATPQATPMWLWDNDAKALKRVMVGTPDSGGKGFRALVIAN